MAYKHGVYVSEVATSLIPPVNTSAGLPVVFGTAPVHLAAEPADANKPVLCYTYAEAVAAFGYSDDWKSYTLCEAMTAAFSLYNRAPIVFVNVLDPAKHKKSVKGEELPMADKTSVIDKPVILSTLKVKKASSGEALAAGKDYEAGYNDNGGVTITALVGGGIEVINNIFVDYDMLDPSAIKATDIVGGVDVSTGAESGLEVLEQVFTETGLVPGMVLAPGWSENPEVAAVMRAKASNINGSFSAITLNDIPTQTVTKYTDVAKWKNNNNYTDPLQIACWPLVRLSETVYHMSTHVMGVLMVLDSTNDDIPYESPSNKSMQINGLCLADGTEVRLNKEQANYLNGQGVVTALNFLGGWKCWGNRTACYPANTDPKDAFICVRRMFIWHAQTFILTYWQKVDKPITKRLIQTIIDSENVRINGLVGQGALLGGRIEFLSDENPTTNLIDGKIKFHTYLTPPVPARVIDNVIEYDPSYFSTLFA